MSYNWDIIGESGLQFYGKMSASISHEIKNVLAIINENAGLLEDFTHLAKKGHPFELERLKPVTERVIKQVQRADGIIKKLNAFAHSIDKSGTKIDLNETLELVVALSERFVAMRRINLVQTFHTSPIMITIRPFFLQNLVWLCLDFAMNVVGDEKRLVLVTEETKDSARIIFTNLKALTSGSPMDTFPAEQEKALLSLLNAQLAIDLEAGKLIITFARDIRR